MTTPQRVYANSFKTTLASPVAPGDSSIIVTDASRAPVLAANQFFSVTLDTGSTFEIIDVYGVSGNVLTGCLRAREGTAAQNFLTGTRVENRATAGTFSDFARLVDRVADIASVDLLDTVANSPSNSYLCASTDDGGTPILAVKSGSHWRFGTHPRVALNGSVESAGTTTSMPLTAASTQIPVTTAGSHIIQFITGSNAGLARIIQSASTSALNWSGALPYAVATSDQYEIYESTAFTTNALKAGSDDALIFSILFGG